MRPIYVMVMVGLLATTMGCAGIMEKLGGGDKASGDSASGSGEAADEARSTALATYAASTCETAISTYETHKDAIANWKGGRDDLEARKEAISTVASKLAACNKWDYVIEKIAHMGPDKHGIGYAVISTLGAEGTDWNKQLFGYTDRHKGQPFLDFEDSLYFLSHYADYTFDNRKKIDCDKLVPIIKDVSEDKFGGLNWLMRKGDCKAAADIIVKRLASKRTSVRSGACNSLGVLGTKSKHMEYVERLSKTDPAFSLITKDAKGRPFATPLKVYPVREKCASAANQLMFK